MPNERTYVATNKKRNSVEEVGLKAIKFQDLWDAYPTSPPLIDKKTGKPPAGWENQCAMRMSVALQNAGQSMNSYRGATHPVDGKTLAIRAEELAAWLGKNPIPGQGQVEDITGKDWSDKILPRTGLVFFKDYWRRDLANGSKEKNHSGDHIDLWNMSRMKVVSDYNMFFELMWNIGLPIDLTPEGLKNKLNLAKLILFWEIK